MNSRSIAPALATAALIEGGAKALDWFSDLYRGGFARLQHHAKKARRSKA